MPARPPGRARGRILAAAAMILLAQGGNARAQEPALPEWASVERPVERRAFVLALSRYQHLESLPSVERDLEALRRTLGPQLGFKVTEPQGPLDRGTILDAFNAFVATIQRDDTVLFYFSGHGFERDGANFIAPPELARLDPQRDIGLQAIALEYFMHEIKQRGARLTILILDACRTDALPAASAAVAAAPVPPSTAPATIAADGQEAGRAADAVPASEPGAGAPADVLGAGNGFIKIPGGGRVFIAFAAAPGQPSYGSVRNDPIGLPSVFTRSFVERVPEANAYWTDALNEVWGDVRALTEEQQEPWISAAGFPQRLVLNQTDDYASRMRKAWRDAALAPPDQLPDALCSFLKLYPDSRFAAAGRVQLLRLQPTLPPGRRCNSI